MLHNIARDDVNHMIDTWLRDHEVVKLPPAYCAPTQSYKRRDPVQQRQPVQPVLFEV